jgi:exonuclease sbcCD, D subunit
MNKDLSEDQKYILDEIVKEVRDKKPDAIVIAGDVYNNSVPSSDAIEIFDGFISKLVAVAPKMHIMVISGNHDSAVRINQFRKVLSGYNLHLIGLPPKRADEYIEKVVLEDEYGKVNFYLLPFVRPSFVKNVFGLDENENNLSYNEALHRLIEREDIDENERNVLVSHQYYLPLGKNPEEVERMDSEIKSVGNIDLVDADILERFDYSALGHIHKPWKVLGDCHRYCGTPLPCSVSEAGQEKGIVMVEMLEKGRINTEVLPLKPLRNIKVVRGRLEEVIMMGSEDYVTVILTEDTTDVDSADRIRERFPNLLEIRREAVKKVEGSRLTEISDELSEIDNCRLFLSEVNPEEEKILTEIINGLKGV